MEATTRIWPWLGCLMCAIFAKKLFSGGASRQRVEFGGGLDVIDHRVCEVRGYETGYGLCVGPYGRQWRRVVGSTRARVGTRSGKQRCGYGGGVSPLCRVWRWP